LKKIAAAVLHGPGNLACLSRRIIWRSQGGKQNQQDGGGGPAAVFYAFVHFFPCVFSERFLSQFHTTRKLKKQHASAAQGGGAAGIFAKII
jgi:hypothetical protein